VDAAAREHFEAGERLYHAEAFDEAIAEWQRGYAIAPAPVFEFWMAEAHRLMERCVEARKLYDAFLAAKPGPEAKELATDGRIACQTDPSGTLQPVDPVPDTPPVASLQPAGDVDPGPPQRDVWYLDMTGDVLVGGGVVSIGVGVGFTIAAAASRSSARDAASLEEFRRHDDALGRRRLVAIVGYVAGAGLLGAGLYRWLDVSRADDSLEMAGWVGDGEAGVGLAGSF
jgi:hypothetical protein